MNTRSTPPPAHNLVVLSADLLAVAAKNLLEQLAHANWPPADRLRQALDTFDAVRIGDEITSAQDPQRMNIADWTAPTDCAGCHCKHWGSCNHATGEDCYEPRAQSRFVRSIATDEPAPVTQRSVRP